MSFLLSQLLKTSGAQVSRGIAAATGIFDFGLSLGYGLEFLLGTLALERGTLPLLAIGSRVFFPNYSLCQG